ncbi:hypothetical protein [Bradyrhizobium elkanii]|uniref:Uncharacterized protein n=1 Tax=Bradyrhizobium elkanii TaxID=29448 RepID=A0A8I1YDT7_BRAEL|nr:hypothetical protein [Bradyrhizobium elkanii]MBP1297567.1 hypothetical protein [Bradyrhizobium elkanii]MCS3577669.1 hypothetical protein [Bradyrhizobium elkanii]MCS3720544.1 hypothetical protein [Bradyrhizobium elkanii]MCS4004961.1 hypothetical protein [Bradyrhizobium elkanii USDA 61]BBC00117.1 hypothetical protein BE61_55710 [Bradyrhizobium elkanii USDA 61]
MSKQIERSLKPASVAVISFAVGLAFSFFTLPLWVTFAINLARDGGRADWLGVSGNVAGGIIGGAMTLVAAVVAWRGIEHQVQKQVDLAADLLEQDRAALKAGLYAEISDRAARCVNDYVNPWRDWPRTRFLTTDIRKFTPTENVVLPAVAGKLGLLDASTLPAVTQFYFRLAVLAQAIDFVASETERNDTAVTGLLQDQHVNMIKERFYSCFDPALRALNGLDVPEAERFEDEALKIYPHLKRTGRSVREALEDLTTGRL